MLSYIHAYHAGNHADILKHTVLVLLMESLNAKQKPYTFFDTHAGSGLYSLDDERALKTGESERGIERLLKIAENKSPPEEMRSYLEIAKKYYALRKYPGSPLIVSDLLFEESVHIASELHRTEFENLKENMRSRKINLHQRNGWEMLNALTPPKIKRGAILCDPSYEELSDYENAHKFLSAVYKKWQTATISLWYPLIRYRRDVIENMKSALFASVKKINASTEILDVDLCVESENAHKETSLKDTIGSESPRLYGSGMFIINPPWKLDEKLSVILPYLRDVLRK